MTWLTRVVTRNRAGPESGSRNGSTNLVGKPGVVEYHEGRRAGRQQRGQRLSRHPGVDQAGVVAAQPGAELADQRRELGVSPLLAQVHPEQPARKGLPHLRSGADHAGQDGLAQTTATGDPGHGHGVGSVGRQQSIENLVELRGSLHHVRRDPVGVEPGLRPSAPAGAARTVGQGAHPGRTGWCRPVAALALARARGEDEAADLRHEGVARHRPIETPLSVDVSGAKPQIAFDDYREDGNAVLIREIQFVLDPRRRLRPRGRHQHHRRRVRQPLLQPFAPPGADLRHQVEPNRNFAFLQIVLEPLDVLDILTRVTDEDVWAAHGAHHAGPGGVGGPALPGARWRHS
jgi:hypothetical protein